MISCRLRAVTAAVVVIVASALVGPAVASAKVVGPNENDPLNLPGPTARHLGVSGGSSNLARTFIGLAVVVAVIYGLYWVLRQVKSSREERSSGYGLSTHASVPLGPNRSLHLVRAGRELHLVGVADHNVVPIRTYSEDEAREAGLIPDEDAADQTPDARPAAPVAGLLEAARRWTVRK